MKGKFQSETYIKFIIYSVIIILVNIVGLTLFFRADLTKNKIYSLSDASKTAVAKLSEPLTINVFFTEKLPAPHNNTKRYLQDLLEEYAIFADKYFNFRFYNVSPKAEGMSDTAMENQELAESYGIYPVEIRMVEKDELKFKKAYMGMVMIQGDIIEKIPAIISTDGLEYRLTNTIKKLNNKISVLASLPEKIDIQFIMSSSINRIAPVIGIKDIPNLPETIKATVDRLNTKNYGQLNYSYVDPSTDKAIDEVMKKNNLRVLQWPNIPDKNIEAGRGAIGLVMAYKDKETEIQIINVLRLPIFGNRYELIDMENLEEVINETIETLIGINEDIGYLADHGTPGLAPPMMMGQQQGDHLRNFQALMSDNYTFDNITLTNENIPESLNCLIIVQPTKKFTDYELYKIDQALMRGANLAIFTNAFKEIPQTPQQQFMFNTGPTYQPLNTGLEKLLAHYGIRVKPSFIMDKNCFKQNMSTRAGGGERPIYFAPMIKNEFINHDLDFLKNIKGLVTMNVSPVSIDMEKIKQNGLSAHQLIASSNESWEMTGQINLNPMMIQPPKADEKLKSYPMAYLLEGQFTSYFNGKDIPKQEVETPDKTIDDMGPDGLNETGESEKEDSALSKIESKNNFIATGKNAKIFIAGSSAILNDNILDPEGRGPNAVFILNIIDTLNNRDDIAVMRSKTQQFNPLNETGIMTKIFIKTFNIAGLPFLVVVLGMFIWWRRKARRKNIQMMFQR